MTWFTDDPVDLGPLTGPPFNGSSQFQLDITMTVTSDAAGAGFYGGVIVGDPPPAAGQGIAGGAHPGRLAAAMAGMAARPGRGRRTRLARWLWQRRRSPSATARCATRRPEGGGRGEQIILPPCRGEENVRRRRLKPALDGEGTASGGGGNAARRRYRPAADGFTNCP